MMSKLDVTDRLAFLGEKFDVFEDKTMEDVESKMKSMTENGWSESQILHGNGTTAKSVIAIVSTKENKKGRILIKVSVPSRIFTNMVGADPTPNKMCLQWMLNTFSKYIKIGNIEGAFQFAFEDLPQAHEYLILFEGNKRKKRFKEMAEFILPDVKNITNINDYRNLSQLYDAVDPFIERDPTEIESLMDRYVKMGQAEIPFKDRYYTVYVPKTVDASVIFGNFASWCTAQKGNGMFKSYTTDYPKPNGKPSDIYIVIDNGFFKGDNENLYQLHFEWMDRGQFQNRKQRGKLDFYDEVLVRSEGLRNYFGKVLKTLAGEFKKGLESNFYIDILIAFGFTEALFDAIDEDTPIIQIDIDTNTKKRKVPKLPDVSRFKKIKIMVIGDASLREIHPSIGTLSSLRCLSFYRNNIKELPSEIGNLSDLIFLNLVGNPISVIPDNIKRLDKTNGGKLHRLSINKKDVSEANYLRLKKLLPSVIID